MFKTQVCSCLKFSVHLQYWVDGVMAAGKGTGRSDYPHVHNFLVIISFFANACYIFAAVIRPVHRVPLGLNLLLQRAAHTFPLME